MKIEQIWQDLTTEKVIGKGSYGTVYRCCRENNGEKEYSAVKVISIPQTGEEYYGYNTEGMTIEQTKEYYRDIVDDFTNEIKILESLKGNKNIVEIKNYEVIEKTEEIGWEIFIEMELLTDFNSYACDKTFTEDEVLKLGIDLCNALYVCNEKNIIHRDIKPENIFVSDTGDFKLGDFGVSRQLEKTDASMSRKGTFNYMAPEVFYSKKYDSRADVYSLGLVMYKLLNNNRMPFLDAEKQIIKYSERQEAFDKRINGEKIPPISGISDELNEVILRACEYKAEDRYNSADEFRKALEKRKLTGFAGWIYRHKIVVRASIIALVVLSLSVSVAIALKFGNDKPEDTVVDGGDPGIVDYVYMESGDVYTKNPVNGKYVYTNNEGVFIFDEQTEKTTQLYDEESSAPAFDGFGICFVSDKVVYQTTEDSKKPDKVYTAKDFDLSRIVYFDGECIVAITSEEKDEKTLYRLMFIDIASESYEEIATLGDDDYALYANGNVIYLENATANVAGSRMYAYNVGNRESILISEEVFAEENFATFSDGQLNYLSKTDESELKVMTCSFDAQVNEDVTKEIKSCKDVIWWDGKNVIYLNEDGKVNIYNIEKETVTEVKEDLDEVYTYDGKYYAFEKFTDGYRLNEICADGNIKASMYTDNIKNKFDVIAIKKDKFLSWNSDSATFASVKTNGIDPMLIEADKRAWTLFENETMGDFAVYVNESNYDCQNVDFKSFLYNYFLEKDGQSAIYYGYFGEAETFSYKDVPDPKQRFNFENPYGWDPADVGGYRRYQIENIKWVCENIFNVDFEMISDFSTKENEYEFYAGEGQEPYFYDGYLYVPFYYGGDGGRDRKLESKSELADGRYLVTVGMYAIDSDEKIGEFELTIGYKNVSGSKHWSLYKLQVIASIGDLEDLNDLENQINSEEEVVYPNPNSDYIEYVKDDNGDLIGVDVYIIGDFTEEFCAQSSYCGNVMIDYRDGDIWRSVTYSYYLDKVIKGECIYGLTDGYADGDKKISETEIEYSQTNKGTFNDGYYVIRLVFDEPLPYVDTEYTRFVCITEGFLRNSEYGFMNYSYTDFQSDSSFLA